MQQAKERQKGDDHKHKSRRSFECQEDRMQDPVCPDSEIDHNIVLFKAQEDHACRHQQQYDQGCDDPFFLFPLHCFLLLHTSLLLSRAANACCLMLSERCRLFLLSFSVSALAQGNQSRAVIAADLTEEQIEQVYNPSGVSSPASSACFCSFSDTFSKDVFR